MAAVYLSPLYLLLNVYLARWLVKWMGACSLRLDKRGPKAAACTVYFLFVLSPAAAFFLPAGTGIRRVMEIIGNTWLGFLLYAALLVGLADLLRVILRRRAAGKRNPRRTLAVSGGVCVLLAACICVYGTVNAGIIRVKEVELAVDKSAGNFSSLRVVLAADLHLGYSVDSGRMEQMVEKINVQDPDLVVFAGDIFDNDFDALDDPARLASILKGIKSRYGVYACYGNHDVSEKILVGFTFDKDGKKESDLRMDRLLQDAGIRLLRDEGVWIGDSVYLYGRPDSSRPGRGISVRKSPAEITAGLDPEKPVLVIDHEPKELSELAAAGVDVDLSGHTHDGQVFPGNLIIRCFWENACGYLNKDGMHSVVTSGVGLFGPNLRVGTAAEICTVTLHFS